MRTSVAILLIVMGTLLIMVPALFDLIHEHLIFSLLKGNANLNVTLPNNLEGIHRFGYWLTGTLMVLIGVVSSFRPTVRSVVAPAAMLTKPA